MIFSTQQMKMTYNFMSQADEDTIQNLLISIPMTQLRKLLKTVERSIRNKDPLFDCLCVTCHLHSVNAEDGFEVCDSCLVE